MSYSLLEQYSRDIDYYVFNLKIGLLHFASAGGRLPSIIEGNDLNNEQLHLAILELPSSYEIEINPNLTEITGLSGQQLETYLADFISIAKRGLFSFDKTNINVQQDSNYHLVAWPKEPMPLYPIWPFDFLNSSICNIILNTSSIPFNSKPNENWPFKLNLDQE